MKDFVDGALTAMVAASTNGTAIVGPHVRPVTLLIELAAADSVTYTIAAAAPGSAPAQTVTRSGTEMRRVEEPLGRNTDCYLTAKSGSPMFRVY